MSFKILNIHENPIDIFLTNISCSLNPFFYRTGHTPNIITTYSFICGLLAVFFLYRGNVALFSILFFISYFFDCCDGSLAREHHMESSFGDLYDHITDVVVFSLIIIVVIIRYHSVIDILSCVIFVVFLFFTLMHLGCQQSNCANCSGTETLDSLKSLCGDKCHISWTRSCGNGTFIVVIILLITYLNFKADSVSSAV